MEFMENRPDEAPAVPPGDSVGARLWTLIVKPGLCMEWVKARPRWWVTLVILLILVGGFSALTCHISGPESLDLMRDSRLGRLAEDQVWEERYEEVLNPTLSDRLLNGVGGAVQSACILFAYSVLFFLFTRLAGGQGKFKQVLGVTYWAMLIPFGLGSLINLPLAFAKHTVMGISIGLAALIPGAEVASVKYQVLHHFGHFLMWWGVFVVVIGIEKVHGFSRSKAAVTVILPWLLISLILLGFSLLVVL